MKVRCEQCGNMVEKMVGHVNRAKKVGLKLFCSQKCFGLSRRIERTKEEDKQIKYFYDRLIWLSDDGRLKKQKQEYFKKDYAANPEKYREVRKRRQQAHNEYCRRPEYKKWKKEYDRKYKTKEYYGEYSEAAIALYELARIVDNRQAKADSRIINKQQKRKRNGKNTQRKELESCAVGIYQPS